MLSVKKEGMMNMITSRNDILQKAVETYKAVYEKAADRYENKLQYTIVDTVGYNCTLIEELFRPLWAIAPVISENDFKININGTSVSICDFINKIMYTEINEFVKRCFVYFSDFFVFFGILGCFIPGAVKDKSVPV